MNSKIEEPLTAKIQCLRAKCLTKNNCRKCPYMGTVFAENVDEDLLNYIASAADMLKLRHGGITRELISEALRIYLKIVKIFKIDDLIENVNQNMTSPTILITSRLNPVINKKFIQYLQKKYKKENINKHYSKEINTAIAIYIHCIQIPWIKSIEDFEYTLGKTNTLYKECVSEGVDVYEYF